MAESRRRAGFLSRILPVPRPEGTAPTLVVFIDYENVQKVDLGRWSENPRVAVRVYLGRNQRSMSADFVRQAQSLGSRLEYVSMEGEGKNHLDFHIAFDLGHFHAMMPQGTEFAVVSNDRGFDGMLRSLRKLGRTVKRLGPGGEEKERTERAEKPERAEKAERPEKVERAEKADRPEKAERPEKIERPTSVDVSPATAKILENLMEISPARRPKKRATLENHIDSVFKPLGGNYSVAEVMAEMLKEGLISETPTQRVTYHF